MTELVSRSSVDVRLCERMQQLHDLLWMSPELAGASSEPKAVQGFADFHVRLPLFSKLNGLGSDFCVNISKFSRYDVLRSPWFWRGWGRFPGGDQEYPSRG